MSVSQGTTSLAANGFANLPIAKQVGLLIGLAASVAIGVAVVFWSVDPEFRPLFSDLSDQDSNEILDILQTEHIPFKIDKGRGTILVPADDVHDARIKVAGSGLPHGAGLGFEMLDKETGIGTSQFIETARYRHALENELVRTISSFRNVKSARVHLAIPKQTGFLRNARKPTASIFVDLYNGTTLSRDNVGAIVHLVASSVPELSSDQVTVVDNEGHLLTDGDGTDAMASADKQLNYHQSIEASYAKKIQDLLEQVLGEGKVQARVNADIDFTQVEETQESYLPDSKVLRSEQSSQESHTGPGADQAKGIPGALSNTPPPKAEPAKKGETEAAASAQVDNISQAVKNYEIDKKISHKQNPMGVVKRLSVAVVLDDHDVYDEKTGKLSHKKISEDEIANYTKLVKDAVGFDEKRGDSINIINSTFAKPAPEEKLPDPKFFEQPWVWALCKQIGAGVFLLIFVLGVLRPILKGLATKSANNAYAGVTGPGGEIPAGMLLPDGTIAPGAHKNDLKALGHLQSHEQNMALLQELAKQDPQRVARVVKTWVDG